MAACPLPSEVLRLYRQLLREGRRFSDYNYRAYVVRRVKDYFKDKKTLTDAESIAQEYQYGLQSLSLIKRQVAVGNMYSHAKQVVE